MKLQTINKFRYVTPQFQFIEYTRNETVMAAANSIICSNAALQVSHYLYWSNLNPRGYETQQCS
jgi:hypothetical protein